MNDSIIKFSPDSLEEKTTLLSETKDFAAAILVRNQDELVEANELLKDVKAEIKAIQEMKDTAVRPMNEALTAVRNWFRPVETLCAEVEKIVKDKIAAFTIAERKRAEEEAQKMLKAADTADFNTLSALVQEAKPVPVAKGTSVREVWSARILDAAKVPREYCIPDEKRIGALARSAKTEDELPKIPGVVFEKKAIVTSR